MARRLFKDKLISKSEIENNGEVIKLIDGSNFDYISNRGNVYSENLPGMLFKKSTFINKSNGYVYVNVCLKKNKMVQRRVHRLIAIAFVKNDDPKHKTVVMHKDNNKTNNNINNLKWGTISENTKQAFDDGLCKNASGFEDSQSKPCILFDNIGNIISIYGSLSEAYRITNVNKRYISLYCHHKIQKPIIINNKECYFRFKDEFDEKGFVL